MLSKINQNIFIKTCSFKLMAANFGCRMTVIRTRQGLVIHSPVRLTKELRKDIDALGTVSFLIAPNNFHHLHIKDWVRAYPDAISLVPSRVKKLYQDVAFSHTFAQNSSLELPKELSYSILSGRMNACEMVLFHKPSKTLVVTDMMFNLRASNFSERILFPVFGIRDSPSSSKLFKFLYRKNVSNRSIAADIRSWPFERIILSHGHIIEENAKSIFNTASSWL